MCRNDTNVPAVNIKEAGKCFTLFLMIMIIHSHTKNQVNISKHSEQKVVTTKYLAITRPKIIGPERNVNLICNLLLYTHIPNQYLKA